MDGRHGANGSQADFPSTLVASPSQTGNAAAAVVGSELSTELSHAMSGLYSTVDLPSLSTSDWNFTAAPNSTGSTPEVHGIVEVVFISVVVAILAIVTAGGNLMVMVSFKMDKQLQTVSNYFLLSLSVADFAIGVFSMPLYTVYLLMNRWPMGPLMCDIWLSLDYTMSNASVANLLIISFDRYLSVTRPLTYRAKRTPKRAAIMITCAWVISALMWTPWIIAWPYIEGKRSVPEDDCYIQFLVSNKYITIITACAAFFLPVMIMCVLYYRIYLETEKRQRDLASLQANRRTGPPCRVDSSEDEVYANLRRTDSSPDLEELDDGHAVPGESRGHHHHSRSCWQKFLFMCRIDRDTSDFPDEESSSDTPGSPAYGSRTPTSSAHGPHGTHNHHGNRTGSLRSKDHMQQNGKNHSRRHSGSGLTIPLINMESNRTTPTATPSTDVTAVSFSRHSNLSSIAGSASMSSDVAGAAKRPPSRPSSDMYTILIKLPESSDESAKPSIRMIADGEPETEDDVIMSETDGESIPMERRNLQKADQVVDKHVELKEENKLTDLVNLSDQFPSVGRRLTQSSDALRVAMQARITARQAEKARTQRARKKKLESKQEKKAAKTLSAILLAFIITWTPYNVFTVIQVFCADCIPEWLYAIGKSALPTTCIYRNGSTTIVSILAIIIVVAITIIIPCFVMISETGRCPCGGQPTGTLYWRSLGVLRLTR